MKQEIKLFQSFKLRSVETKNRVVISPMCQYSAHDGHLDDWHLVNLGRFAIGGAGIIFTEASAIQKDGRITHGCPGLWSNTQIPGHTRVAQFILQNGAIPAIQLAHAGRKSGMQRPWFGNGPLDEADFERGDIGWAPCGPSSIPVDENWPIPKELSSRDIEILIEDYVSATNRALAAGYKLIEVHGAHGYLLHSFLSPLSNHRTDAYGGSRTNRMRLTLEVVEAVRATMPSNFPLSFRTSAIDGNTEGWQIEDSVVLARELKKCGVDIIDCSSGGISGSATASNRGRRKPSFQVPYSARIRSDANMPTIAVGLITHPKQAEDILLRGEADLIAIGREALANPMWSLHAAQALKHDTNYETWPIQTGWWLNVRDQTSVFYKSDK